VTEAPFPQYDVFDGLVRRKGKKINMATSEEKSRKKSACARATEKRPPTNKIRIGM